MLQPIPKLFQDGGEGKERRWPARPFCWPSEGQVGARGARTAGLEVSTSVWVLGMLWGSERPQPGETRDMEPRPHEQDPSRNLAGAAEDPAGAPMSHTRCLRHQKEMRIQLRCEDPGWQIPEGGCMSVCPKAHLRFLLGPQRGRGAQTELTVLGPSTCLSNGSPTLACCPEEPHLLTEPPAGWVCSSQEWMALCNLADAGQVRESAPFALFPCVGPMMRVSPSPLLLVVGTQETKVPVCLKPLPRPCSLPAWVPRPGWSLDAL